MGQQGKGRGVQWRETVAEVLISELVCVGRALEVNFVFGQGVVFALRACLLVLEGFAAALVAFIIDLLWCQQ